ncbi:MAG: outer membrane protein transport protein, partial [Sulfuricurvum sp.]|nr:outer membrane protein transport protein [Sulfuricurvum sp.]
IGIGMSHGAETALSNPALITSVKGTEISFGGTVFMPDVKTNVAGGGEVKSAADLSVIPEVAIAQKVSDNFYWGIGMFGVAGMGTDYRNTGKNMAMVTNLQLMQFAVPLAYKADGLSIAISPIVQYGSLDMNYMVPALMGAGSDFNSSTQGVAQDLGFGYTIGAAYEIDGLTLGASYKSAIDMEYKGQISKASAQFSGFGMPQLSDNLEQPAEIGVGTSYTVDGHTFAADYKRIKWSDAKGYKDFGWDDQDVYIIGYQYSQDGYALRAGYNHSKSPIKQQSGTGSTPLNLLNLLGFPATVEDHYTVGGSLSLNKATSLDLAFVYAPEVTDTFSIAPLGTITTKHSQQAVT